MLLPDKHITIAESILGLSSFALERLQQPVHVDTIWAEFENVNNSKSYPAYHTFENMLLALAFLFSIGVIEKDDRGRILRCD